MRLFGFDTSYTVPGKDGKPVVASVLTKLFSIKPTGQDWSKTTRLLVDIHSEIARVFDKGSAFDVARQAIFDRYKLIEPEKGQELTPEDVLENEERLRLANEEFQARLNDEVELEFTPLSDEVLGTLPPFNTYERQAIKWMIE